MCCVPQGSIIGLYVSFEYINDSSNNISSTTKLFPIDTFLFSVVDDVNISMIQLNNNFEKISK